MAKKSKAYAISEDEKWRCEHDLNTLIEAEKIKADPKRMAACKAMAKEKMMAVASIATEDD